MRQPNRTAGFTLIEALVAVTLLALLFGALMPVFQQGLSVLRSGDRFTRATLVAQSVLEQASALAAVAQQQRDGAAPLVLAEQGEFEEFRWQIERAAYQPLAAQADDPAPIAVDADADPDAPVLARLSVRVSWPGNESGVQLHTLVVERAP